MVKSINFIELCNLLAEIIKYLHFLEQTFIRDWNYNFYMELDTSMVYQHLFDTISDGVYVIDQSGKILIANKNASALLNYTPEEFNSKNHKSLFVNQDEYNNIQESLGNNEIIKNFETKLFTNNNSEITCHLTFNKLDNSFGKENCILVILKDISHFVLLEEEIDIKQRMDVLGTLAGGISHDFNNLLMGIAGNLSLILMDSSQLAKNHTTYLNEALKVIYQASGLIKQFQILAADSTGVLSNIDFYTITEDSFSFLEKATNRLIAKKIEFQAGKYFIKVDRVKLNQVILNLATNSIASIEDRGATNKDFIAIYAKEATEEELKIRDLTGGDYIHIIFEDSGAGMSEEVRKKIFHPFFTTRAKDKFGRGLSLSVVYDIITRQSNGYIDVESQIGAGTKFHIFLPKGEKMVIRKPKEYFIPIIDASEGVLVVDDEPSVRHVLKAALIRMGHTVFIANDGQECIDIYTKHRSKIDIVILDLTMPEMTGEQALEKLLDINPNVKVIISSGHTDHEIRKGILSKAHAHLTKPYDTTELGNIIREIFAK